MLSHASAATDSLSDDIAQTLSKENIEKSLKGVQNTAYVDRLEKEANLYYLRLLKSDLEFARASKKYTENINSDSLRTTAELFGLVIPLSAETILGWKVVKKAINLIPSSFQNASREFYNEAYSVDMVKLETINGTIVQRSLVRGPIHTINLYRVPMALAKSGVSFGLRIVGASVGIATVGTLAVLSYQGGKALIMSDETFEALMKEVDNKIAKLNQEIAASVIKSATEKK
jgi:hypothetical protein